MILLIGNGLTDKGIPITIIYNNANQATQAERDAGYLVESLAPLPPLFNGQMARLHYDPITKAQNYVIYDLEDRKIDKLEAELSIQKEFISLMEANFMYDSMMKELAIEVTNNTQAELMYQLMLNGVL